MGDGQGDVGPVDGDLEGDGQTAPKELTQVPEVVVNVPSEDVKRIILEVEHG